MKTFRSLFRTKAGACALLTFLSLTGATFQPEEGPIGNALTIDQPRDPN